MATRSPADPTPATPASSPVLPGRLPGVPVEASVSRGAPAAVTSEAVGEGDPARRFVLELARALHVYGSTAHRLESSLGAVARQLGLEAQFFSTPTAVFISFGHPGQGQETVLLRIEPGEVDLDKLARLDAVSGRVMDGELDPRQAWREVWAIVEAPPRFGAAATVAAFALTSAAAARFFGGGWAEIAIAGLVGLVIGLLARASGGRPALQRVFPPLSAALASGLAVLAAAGLEALGAGPLSTSGSLSVYTVTVAGLIVLVPGLTLTVAMAELATNNLASGSARLAGAVIVFLTLAFGVALGQQLASFAVGPPTVAVPVPAPAWTELLALALAPLGFAVLFRASLRDVPWIALSGAVAFFGARWGSDLLGPQLGAFFGAVAVAVGANLYARLLDRPASIPLVPGLILLVPGSIGFRSLSALLENDVVSGVETAFAMSLVAVALVTGLLVANVLLPPRKAL